MGEGGEKFGVVFLNHLIANAIGLSPIPGRLPRSSRVIHAFVPM